MAEPGKLWIGSIVIDCKNFDRMVSFWKAALGYEFVRPPSEDWALLFDPHHKGPNLAFQKDPDGPGPVYWFHFDLYSSDPEAEVERLCQLGATVRQPAREGFDYVTLADPDGNPFDLVEARGFSFGQRTE
jgi:catechol 2,3-dioxygenase-like lactoylglutathione lyase family enzyme